MLWLCGGGGEGRRGETKNPTLEPDPPGGGGKGEGGGGSEAGITHGCWLALPSSHTLRRAV